MAKICIKNKLQNIKENYKIFCNFLDEKNDNPKIETARQEIITLIKILPLPMMAIIVIIISGNFTNNGYGGGFLMSGMVFIISAWFLLIIYYEKKKEKK